MAARKILVYPKDKKALRSISDPVRAYGSYTRKLIQDLKDTLMTQPHGIGLAAPQINVLTRVVIVRLGARNEWDREADPPIALVYPVVVEASDPRKDFDGCLSFPDLYGETIRPHFLRVAAQAEDGQLFERSFSGFDAVVVHHEIDHLDGVLFIDRIESLEDLYRVCMDGGGNAVRVPISQIVPTIRITDLAE